MSSDGYHYIEENLGHNVREARRAMGWSQEELAQQMAAHGHEMHQTTVAKLERAARPTTAPELVALSQIFHMSVGLLLATPKDGQDPEVDDEAMAEVQRAMAAVRETYNTLRELSVSEVELQRRWTDARRDHQARIERYEKARKSAGPKSPTLPGYIIAGIRPGHRQRYRDKQRKGGTDGEHREET